MENKMKIYNNNVYPFDLVLSDDFDEVANKYDCNGEELIDHANCRATTYIMNPKGCNTMAVGIVFKTEATPKLAAHEAFHAVYYMLAYGLKMELNDYTDETWAYLIGWVTDCIYDYVG